MSMQECKTTTIYHSRYQFAHPGGLFFTPRPKENHQEVVNIMSAGLRDLLIMITHICWLARLVRAFLRLLFGFI